MTGDRCAHHAELEAVGPCSVCGTLLCGACSRNLGGEVLCEHCALPRAPDAGPPPAALGVDLDGDDDVVVTPAPPPAPIGWRSAATAATHTTPARLPAALFALLAAQTLATLLLGVHLWRLTERMDTRATTGALPTAPTLIAPALDPPPASLDAGAPYEFSGSAPEGELIALAINDHLVAVDVLRSDRFRFAALELGPGDYRVTATAYARTGVAATSAEERFRIAPRATTDARPTVDPARTSILATPTRTPRRTPTPGPSPESTPKAGARSSNVSRGRDQRHIALTFDGGSNANKAEDVLDALRAKGVKSTLFLTGDFIRAYPEVTRRIVRDGHEVGNHTLDHPHLCDWVAGRGHVTRKGIDRAFLLHQLNETRRLFESTTGAKLHDYWRAPYGEFNKEILAWAAADGWTHIGWTDGFDTLDWVADPNDQLYRSATQIRDRLLTRARNGGSARGGIVLMHLGAEREEDAASDELPRIIDGLRREGYELVTVTSLMGS